MKKKIILILLIMILAFIVGYFIGSISSEPIEKKESTVHELLDRIK